MAQGQPGLVGGAFAGGVRSVRVAVGSPAFRRVALLFLVSRGVLYLCMAYLWHRASPGRDLSLEALLVRGDAHAYLRIATEGYGRAGAPSPLLVYFPLFPILVRAGAFLLPAAWSGVLVANLAFLLAMYFVYRVVERAVGKDEADDALVFLAASPIAFFCALPTADALLLLFFALSFWGWEHDKPVVAGLFGMLAALTHLFGVLLFFGMAFGTLSKGKWKIGALAGASAGLLLIPLGLVFYMIYALVVHRSATAVFPEPARITVASADLLDLVAVAIAVVTIIASRELDAAYTWFTVLVVLMPLVVGRGGGLLRPYFLIVPIYVTMAKHLNAKLVAAAVILILASLQITVAASVIR